MSDEEYEVEAILEACLVKKPRKSTRWEFHVKWKGYENNENTWEPIESFNGSERFLEQFWGRVDTGGRDVTDIRLFTVGENFYPIGPPRNKRKRSVAAKEKSASPHVAPQAVHPKPVKARESIRKPSVLKENTTSQVAAVQLDKPRPSKLQMSCTISDNVNNPDILKNICYTLTHPKRGTIANINIVRIDRTRCRGHFLDFMSSQEDDLALLASELFGNDGNLRKWLYASPTWGGSRYWGTEMNSGALFYVRSITNHHSLKDDHSLSQAIRHLLISESIEQGDFVLSHLPSTLPSQIIQIYRNHHFRRIGLTEFFAWSSRSILYRLKDTDKTEPRSRHTFPIQFAIANMDVTEVESIIRNCHSTDGDSIRKPDDHGFTPIYVATLHSHLPATRLLLELGVGRADILCRDNDHRLTPLERLQENISGRHDIASRLIHIDNDHPEVTRQRETTMEALLKQAIGDIVDPVCTCLMCDEGWLSPRMRSHLQKIAGKLSSEMNHTTFYFPAAYREPLSPEQRQQDHLLRYVPADIEVHKTFYNGYADFMAILENILAQRTNHRIPSVTSVCRYFRELSSYQNREKTFFLSKGGRVHHVLDCLISIASDSSGESTGDSDEDLPHCTNDLNFDLVRSKVGL